MMTTRSFVTIILPVFAIASGFCQEEARLSVSLSPENVLAIVIGSSIHEKYGCAYPMTYRIGIPQGKTDLRAYCRSSSAGPWELLQEKTRAEFFNALEMTRFDYSGNVAFVSASFDSTSDSLFIRIEDAGGSTVTPAYQGITKYYDNRNAAVVITGDDCADWTSGWFPSILDCFRSYKLYPTAAIITGDGWCSAATWAQFQQQVDSGFVELASHARTHPYTPYSDYAGEVEGSADDIVNNVRLPALFRRGQHEYVYVWVAPYGNYDETVDSLIGVRGYLVSRMYSTLGDVAFTDWENSRGHFAPIGLTVEIGAPSWGGGETDPNVLNATFDRTVVKGGVYHLMWHAQTVYSDLEKSYFKNHLTYISGRKDIWYVNLGHLYLYHLMQMMNSTGTAGIASRHEQPVPARLLQNYPNPFNPSTVIRYQVSGLSDVKLAVYDALGRELVVLVNERQAAGMYSMPFNGRGLPSGVYVYRLTGTGVAQSQRMVLLK